jgi:hypothetical protein
MASHEDVGMSAIFAMEPAPEPEPEELYQPPILESADGVLDVTLTIKLAESLGNTRLSPLYNGQPMGPTIKLKPGDVLTLTLDNQLSPSSDGEKATMETLKDPEADVASVTKLYNRLQEDGSLHGPVTPFFVKLSLAWHWFLP